MAFIAPGATFVYSIRGCIVNLLSLPMRYSKEKCLPEIFLANRPAHALSLPLTPTGEPRCLRNTHCLTKICLCNQFPLHLLHRVGVMSSASRPAFSPLRFWQFLFVVTNKRGRYEMRQAWQASGQKAVCSCISRGGETCH